MEWVHRWRSGSPPMPVGRFGVATPWRAAPSAVRRLEDATEPKRRARIAGDCRAAAVSDRLRRPLSNLAAWRASRAAAASDFPTVDDPQTVPGFAPADQTATGS